jgi:DNA-binding Lrp family transcriptional regulator
MTEESMENDSFTTELRKSRLNLGVVSLLRQNEGKWEWQPKTPITTTMAEALNSTSSAVIASLKKLEQNGIITITRRGVNPVKVVLVNTPDTWEEDTRPTKRADGTTYPDPLAISLPEAPPAPEDPATPHERLAAAVGLILEVLGEPVISQDMDLADRVSSLLEDNTRLRRRIEVMEDANRALNDQNRGLIALKRQLEENIKKLAGNGKVDDRAYRNLERFMKEPPNAKR